MQNNEVRMGSMIVEFVSAEIAALSKPVMRRLASDPDESAITDLFQHLHRKVSEGFIKG